jgi:hypothetical protein
MNYSASPTLICPSAIVRTLLNSAAWVPELLGVTDMDY